MPGSKNVRNTRLAVALAMDGGETPFSIMLKSAREHWKKAAPDGENVVDYEAARTAAAIAKDCAPFVHPRLNSIALEGADGSSINIVFDREDSRA